jgi:phospholipase/carboxylesterase
MADSIIKGELRKGQKVLIMVHGRGASAHDILSLSAYLSVGGFTLIAPQAEDHTWYPFSFMAPQNQNEPHLSNSLKVLGKIVSEVLDKGIAEDAIYFLGFSQGACLTLEYTTRNATRWGGVIAFTGGLIGDELNETNYKGDFQNTPIYIGTSDPDPHVPLSRVIETKNILEAMNASMDVEIFKNMGHTINQTELDKANRILEL